MIVFVPARVLQLEARVRLDQGDERMPERSVVRATASEFGIDLFIHGRSPHLFQR
jgi:hypothetical protein